MSIGGGARGGGSPWRPPRRSTYPCGCWGSPCGASAGRTAGRFARASPPRRRPSGCRTWPVSMRCGGGVCQASLVKRRARDTVGWKEAYLEAREHHILCFGPRSTLEVKGIGHERWVWGWERGGGRAMRCVFWWNGASGSERYDFFPRGPYGRPVSKFSFLPPGEICHGVRFSPLLISPPRLVGDLLAGTRAPATLDRRRASWREEMPRRRRLAASPHTAVRAGPDERHD